MLVVMTFYFESSLQLHLHWQVEGLLFARRKFSGREWGGGETYSISTELMNIVDKKNELNIIWFPFQLVFLLSNSRGGETNSSEEKS